jgi:hypothetical protein
MGAKYDLIFPLLYGNIMDPEQIWVNRHSMS